jgi:hypothetical protein
MNESEQAAIATVQLAYVLQRAFWISAADALRLALQLRLAFQLYQVRR